MTWSELQSAIQEISFNSRVCHAPQIDILEALEYENIANAIEHRLKEGALDDIFQVPKRQRELEKKDREVGLSFDELQELMEIRENRR